MIRSVAEDLAALTRTSRVVGEPGNAEANEYFAARIGGLGWQLERIGFDCVTWKRGPARLAADDGRSWELRSGSYSPPFSGRGTLLPVGTVEELETVTAPGSVLLLHGEVAAEQLTPKNYPFYRWESHTRILTALEAAAPAAIVSATGRDRAMVGQLYPFSPIEDGDFEIPSAYLKDVEGAELLELAGRYVSLEIDSDRLPGRAEQLIARLPGAVGPRIVVVAHIDTYRDTPGALDNAAGVCALLALAELLAENPATARVEIVPFNGEDHYSAAGQMAYLAENGPSLGEVTLAINIDAAALAGHVSEVSLYGCPEPLAATIREALEGRPGLAEGEQWPQSDHMVFAMRGVPAIAVTCEGAATLAREVAHTPRDVPELVDPAAIVQVAEFLAELISRLGRAG